MSLRTTLKLIFLSTLFTALVAVASAVTASNTVDESGLGRNSEAVSANQLKPDECNGINLNSIISGSGTINGTAGNDLILGSTGVDTLNGGAGDDCLVGGNGADVLAGEAGNDVLVAGDGDDDLNGGTETDVCYGQAGTDTFTACETENDF